MGRDVWHMRAANPIDDRKTRGAAAYEHTHPQQRGRRTASMLSASQAAAHQEDLSLSSTWQRGCTNLLPISFPNCQCRALPSLAYWSRQRREPWETP